MFVDSIEDDAGMIVLSRSKALRIKGWDTVVKKFEDAFKGKSRKELEDMHDLIVRGGLDVTLDEHYIIVADKYGTEIADCFKEYKKVTDKIYERLKEVYPDLPSHATHYGQSIKWRKKNGLVLDDEFDWVVVPEKSILEGSKHFTKA